MNECARYTITMNECARYTITMNECDVKNFEVNLPWGELTCVRRGLEVRASLCHPPPEVVQAVGQRRRQGCAARTHGTVHLATQGMVITHLATQGLLITHLATQCLVITHLATQGLVISHGNTRPGNCLNGNTIPGNCSSTQYLIVTYLDTIDIYQHSIGYDII